MGDLMEVHGGVLVAFVFVFFVVVPVVTARVAGFNRLDEYEMTSITEQIKAARESAGWHERIAMTGGTKRAPTNDHDEAERKARMALSAIKKGIDTSAGIRLHTNLSTDETTRAIRKLINENRIYRIRKAHYAPVLTTEEA